MFHDPVPILAVLACLGAADEAPTVLSFDTAEAGKPMPSYTDRGVVFALSRPPTTSRAAGRVMFFPHLKTPRKGILNAMANEAIPVEVRFPKPVASVTLVLWGSIGSEAVVEAYDSDGRLVDRASRDRVPERTGPEQPVPSFDMTVRAPAIAYVCFSGAPPGGYLACDEVRITPTAEAEVGKSLRQAADGRFLVGTAVLSRHLNNPDLAALIAEQYDCLTAENEFKPISLHPQPDRYNFAAADKIVEFAGQHRMKVIGHTLCWHSQSPPWLFRGPGGMPLPRDEALRNLKDHIDTVMAHFRGKVFGWDVVNEAISDARDGYLRDTPARRAIGDDYIAEAFGFARAADPDAELYYNDYGNEHPEKLDKTIRLIRQLKDRGVRLDGVGLQCHLRLDDADAPDRLDRAIAAYAAEGVKVMITELDVDVLPRRARGADVAAREQDGANPYRDGLPPEVAEAQARFYGQLFRVLRKHPSTVTRVTFWGPHDGASWLNFWPVAGRTNHPLLWDRSLKPKPALATVLDALAAP
ncbi:MAG: endo-1,4-beta-xylanase [Isosphaeraceae bacterium]